MPFVFLRCSVVFTCERLKRQGVRVIKAVTLSRAHVLPPLRTNGSLRFPVLAKMFVISTDFEIMRHPECYIYPSPCPFVERHHTRVTKG